MICEKCGRIIDDDSRFCQYCGYDLYSRIEEEYEEDDLYVQTESSKFKTIALWVLVLGAILLAVFYNNGTDSEENWDYEEEEVENVNYDVLFTPISSQAQISNSMSGGYLTTSGNHVYYIDNSGNIVQGDLDLQNSFILVSGDCSYLTVYNDLLIYCDENHYVYSFNLTNGLNQEIIDSASYYLMVNDHYLYYQNDPDQESIYRYDFNTQESEKLNDEQSYNICVYDQVLYYSTTTGLYCMDLTSNEVQQIIDEEIYTFTILDDSIIYLKADDLYIYSYDLTTNSSECLVDIEVYEYVIDGNTLIFEASSSYNYNICLLDLETGDAYQYSIPGEHLAINANYVYYSDGTDVNLLNLETGDTMVLSCNISGQLL